MTWKYHPTHAGLHTYGKFHVKSFLFWTKNAALAWLEGFLCCYPRVESKQQPKVDKLVVKTGWTKLFPQELACKLITYGMILELHCYAKIIHMYVVYSIFYNNLKYLYITINYARSSNDPYGWSDCFESNARTIMKEQLNGLQILTAVASCCNSWPEGHSSLLLTRNGLPPRPPKGKGFQSPKPVGMLGCYVCCMQQWFLQLSSMRAKNRGW